MKFKKRIVLTILLIACAYFAQFLWGLIQSPATGALTAKQLDDTVQSYTAAKAVRDNTVEKVIDGTCILLIVLIWIIPKKTTKK